jgi:hypothetical protein
LDAKLGHSPSYTWRSIWSTIPLLTLGYRWRIGDGKSINVWSDPWIRTRNNMKPTTPSPYHLSHLTVSQLFDHQQNTWDLTLLNSIMNTQDVSDICKIPLYSRALSDSVVWTSTPSGCYTVKSAYKLCISLTDHESLPRVDGNWKDVWSLQLPQKMKHFCWRLLRLCLPTRFNLHCRGVSCPTTCVLCDDAVEDEMHLFFGCAHS